MVELQTIPLRFRVWNVEENRLALPSEMRRFLDIYEHCSDNGELVDEGPDGGAYSLADIVGYGKCKILGNIFKKPELLEGER